MQSMVPFGKLAVTPLPLLLDEDELDDAAALVSFGVVEVELVVGAT